MLHSPVIQVISLNSWHPLKVSAPHPENPPITGNIPYLIPGSTTWDPGSCVSLITHQFVMYCSFSTMKEQVQSDTFNSACFIWVVKVDHSPSLSFLQAPLNPLKQGRLNIYTSAFACLRLKLHSLSGANSFFWEKKKKDKTRWHDEHQAALGLQPLQVRPPFQDMWGHRDPGVCWRGLLGGGSRHSIAMLLTLRSQWKEAICAFRVGSGPTAI